MKLKLLITPFVFLTAVMPITAVSSCSNTPQVQVESITLSLDKSTVEVGDEVKLTVKVLPDNATNKNVDISITNLSDFYTSESGTIVPYKSGSYNITAKAKDGSGKTDTKVLTVNPEETTTESWEDYANDRTFSLKLSTASSTPLLGTGWILSDATPSILDDYQYYVVTNWHVVNGILSSKLNSSVACGDEGEEITTSDYIDISCELMDESNFLHGGDTINVISAEHGPITALQCCDLYVLKMDLKNIKSSLKPCKTKFINKLNKLNNLTSQGKRITKIAPIVNDSHHFESAAKFYTLGYPAKNRPITKEQYITREQHDFNNESIQLEYIKEKVNIHDLLNQSITYWQYLADCSPQYTSKTTVSSTWMDGGASGSMLLGDFGSDSTHHIYKVCGIYWGVFLNPTLPSYSIFNSDYKNFVANFY